MRFAHDALRCEGLQQSLFRPVRHTVQQAELKTGPL
jgi:hypothetical protein